MVSGAAFLTIILRRASCAANGFSDAGSGSSERARRWFGIQSANRSNQKCEICVSTSPLRGMPLGMMQSKAEMRSVATSRRRSPRSNISRTLPLFIFRTPGKSSWSNGSFVMPAMMKGGKKIQSGKLRADNRRFDLPVGFVGGHEDFVFVVQTERRQVHQQAMLVGHHQMNLRNPRLGLQRRLAHLEEGGLHGRAVCCGKDFQHRVQDGAVRPEITLWSRFPRPGRLHIRGQNAVMRFRQRREFVSWKTREARPGRLQNEQILDARLDARGLPPTHDLREGPGAAGLNEAVRVRLAIDRHRL